jgi:Kef-type K+ transport system membrane component KefB
MIAAVRWARGPWTRNDHRVAFVGSIVDHFPLALGIIGALLAGKWTAATVVGRAFGYSPAAKSTIWALTLPQVAATLAAALVAYDTFNRAGQRMLEIQSNESPWEKATF